MKKKGLLPQKLLTELELEIMSRVWAHYPCTVREVQTALKAEKELAYTSIATIMKILEEKGFLTSQKNEKTHLFSPCVSKESYESKALKHVAEKLFNGSPGSMVARLLDEAELSPEDIKKIRMILKERDKT